jgi:hypothetical protein
MKQPSSLGDYEILLRALQMIREEDPECGCMGGPDCCIEAGEFCPHCIADRAINTYLGLSHHKAVTNEAA